MVKLSGSYPPPVLFTVRSLLLKRKILKKSFEKKGAIQFRNNKSRQDDACHKTLVEELKVRTTAGEINLAICNFPIVSKSGPSQREAPQFQLVPMQH